MCILRYLWLTWTQPASFGSRLGVDDALDLLDVDAEVGELAQELLRLGLEGRRGWARRSRSLAMKSHSAHQPLPF